MKKLTYLIAILLVGIFMLSSCTKGWVDMNKSPNNPTEVPPTNVLAHVIRATGDVFYDDWQGMNNFLSYTGLVTKIQYIDEARLDERESTINAAWHDYYLLLEDLKKVQELADAKTNDRYNKNIKAAAMTFSAFLWIMATDQWGYIPYTDALKGDDPQNPITNPKYDSQKDIYTGPNGIIAMLEKAYSMYDPAAAASGSDIIGDGDLIYHGDVTKWMKFTGSLLLRVAIRLSYVDPALSKQILQDITSGKYMVFESRDDEAKLKWPGTSPYYEPWYNNHYINGRDDHAVAKTIIDSLYNWHDLRLLAIAHPASEESGHLLIINGDSLWFKGQIEGATDADKDLKASRIGYIYRDDPAGYTWFERYAEVEFDLAEAYYRADLLNDPTQAEQYYINGITASYEEMSADPNFGALIAQSLPNYLASPKVKFGPVGDHSMFNFKRGEGASAQYVDDNLVRIWVQKWIAMFKEGQEEWAAMRRTDFPKMPVPEGAVAYLASHNRAPQRYPYPVDEENLNKKNLEDAITAQNLSGRYTFWGAMWWDTRPGVH